MTNKIFICYVTFSVLLWHWLINVYSDDVDCPNSNLESRGSVNVRSLVEWESKFIACMELKKACLDRNYVLVVYDDSLRSTGIRLSAP